MRRLVAVVLAALMLAGLSTSAFAADPAKGTITGTLVNKTANGTSVADKEVTLGTYKGSDAQDKKTTKSDRDGKFSFTGLDTSADFTYQVSVDFQGAPYYSDPVNFSGATPTGQAPSATPVPPTDSKNLQIQVFDSTTDASVLKSTAHHYLLEGDKTGISVTEIIIITNSSDKSYIGTENHSGTNSVLKFSLPQGAQDFEPVDGLYPSRVVQVDGGFVDTMPVYPGMSQRVWRFGIAPNGDTATFSAKLDMGADKVSVLVPDAGATVSVSNLSGPANQDIQGDKYLLFSGQNVAANTELQFKMDKLSSIKPQQSNTGAQPAAGQSAPAPAGSSPVSPTIIGGVLALVVVVVGGAGFVVTRRRRQASARELAGLGADESAEYAGSGDLEAERQALVAAIARLDDLFEQDKIASEEYGRLRTEKKKRLIEVVKAQKAPVGTGSSR